MEGFRDGRGSIIIKMYNNTVLSKEINDRENIAIRAFSNRKNAFAAHAIKGYDFVP